MITLAIGAFLLLAILVLQASFNLKFISPDSNQELLFFAGLSGLIFFAFVALTVVLGRNLLKLYAERRQGVAGSKFRTRLVVVSLLLVVFARDCDVLVLVRADEPLDRQVVFPAGRGSARGYRRHVGTAL